MPTSIRKKDRKNVLLPSQTDISDYFRTLALCPKKKAFSKVNYQAIRMMLCAQTYVLNKFICCILGDYWLRENDVDSAIRRFMNGVSKETLSNDFVEVCVGPLFTHKDEFHVQTIQPFRMPDESDIGRSLWWCILGALRLLRSFHHILVTHKRSPIGARKLRFAGYHSKQG